ncbi:protein kinase, putative [Bodo saltans]|uniref:Protein kinase, putative n=1 Tax=Bodo saltans TaxID=75058 RepID=A0A0S4J7C1_BODSA|nr:protein kinase, putative [Bodo saltans]|eukprot:CUG85764.1 protein kinase, putative [Bodo saltans]
MMGTISATASSRVSPVNPKVSLDPPPVVVPAPAAIVAVAPVPTIAPVPPIVAAATVVLTPPPEFSSPATAQLNYHSARTTQPETTSATFVNHFLATNVKTINATRRFVQRQEEAARQNDISISRKRSRKDDEQAVKSLHEDPENQMNPNSIEVGRLDHTSVSSPCASVDLYENKGRLSEGVYGIVFKAIRAENSNSISNDTTTPIITNPPATTAKKYFALKQIKGQWLAESQVGFPPYLLRELELTMRLRHPNIVHTLEVVYRDDNIKDAAAPPRSSQTTTGTSPVVPPQPSSPATPLTVQGCSVYAVMDFAWRDLKQYLYETKTPFVHLSKRNHHPDATVAYVSRCKCIARQLFEGLAFMHRHRILHRDLKTSNILITSDGTVQIADFGLSRFVRRREMLTPTVVTLMYRAPELHFGISDYDDALDIWSAGCILAELFLKYPLFRGENEAEHCARVCQVLGYPTNDTFEGIFHRKEAVTALTQCLSTVPLVVATTQSQEEGGSGDTTKLREFLLCNPETTYRGAAALPPSGVDLLCSIFQWNPRLRPSAEEILRHPFFAEEDPAPPAKKSDLLRPMPFALPASTKAPSPGLCHSGNASGITALDATVRVSLGNSANGGSSTAECDLIGGTTGEDEDEKRARLEDEEEQEAQAQNVRGTSPEAAAHKRKLGVEDDAANSRVPTPVLVPGSEEEQQ